MADDPGKHPQTPPTSRDQTKQDAAPRPGLRDDGNSQQCSQPQFELPRSASFPARSPSTQLTGNEQDDAPPGQKSPLPHVRFRSFSFDTYAKTDRGIIAPESPSVEVSAHTPRQPHEGEYRQRVDEALSVKKSECSQALAGEPSLERAQHWEEQTSACRPFRHEQLSLHSNAFAPTEICRTDRGVRDVSSHGVERCSSAIAANSPSEIEAQNLPETPSIAAGSSNRNDDPATVLWDRRFEELKHWRQEHGTCIVPKSEGVLGRWTAKQRELAKARKLTASRYRLLQSVGFVWDATAAAWEMQYQALQVFVREHGHACVPSAYPSLGTWVGKMRGKRRRGELEEDKARRLEAVGFVWDPANADWMALYEELKSFREENGHCSVPFNVPRLEKLCWWCSTQRQAFKKGKLSSERISYLENLGFVWRPQEAASANASASASASQARHNPTGSGSMTQNPVATPPESTSRGLPNARQEVSCASQPNTEPLHATWEDVPKSSDIQLDEETQAPDLAQRTPQEAVRYSSAVRSAQHSSPALQQEKHDMFPDNSALEERANELGGNEDLDFSAAGTSSILQVIGSIQEKRYQGTPQTQDQHHGLPPVSALLSIAEEREAEKNNNDTSNRQGQCSRNLC